MEKTILYISPPRLHFFRLFAFVILQICIEEREKERKAGRQTEKHQERGWGRERKAASLEKVILRLGEGGREVMGEV